MDLYGVEHGGRVYVGGVAMNQFDVEPSFEMLNHIKEGLPEGSRVGLEVVDELVYPDYTDEDPLVFDENTAQYWDPIIQACQDSKHHIVPLDNTGIYKHVREKLGALNNLEDALSSGQYEITPGSEQTVREICFAYDAVCKYMLLIAREETIFKQLQNTRPDMAVIGQAHADTLMLTPDLKDSLGVDNYVKLTLDRQGLDSINLLMAETQRVPTCQLVDPSGPDPQYLQETESISRTHRAVTESRITSGSEPQWVGSWEPSCRPRGLFEVFDKSRPGSQESSGTIEDVLGTARFRGELTQDKVIFLKSYIPSKTLDPAALKGEVLYEAERQSDDEYRGEWRSEDGSFGGELVMKRGAEPLYEPIDTDLPGQERLL